MKTNNNKSSQNSPEDKKEAIILSIPEGYSVGTTSNGVSVKNEQAGTSHPTLKAKNGSVIHNKETGHFEFSTSIYDKGFKFLRLRTASEDFLINLIYQNHSAFLLYLILLDFGKNAKGNSYRIECKDRTVYFLSKAINKSVSQTYKLLNYLDENNVIVLVKENKKIQAIGLNTRIISHGKKTNKQIFYKANVSIDSFINSENKDFSSKRRLKLRPIKGKKNRSFRGLSFDQLITLIDLVRLNHHAALIFFYMFREKDKHNQVNFVFKNAVNELSFSDTNRKVYAKAINLLIEFGFINDIGVAEKDKISGVFAVNHHLIWDYDRKDLPQSKFRDRYKKISTYEIVEGENTKPKEIVERIRIDPLSELERHLKENEIPTHKALVKKEFEMASCISEKRAKVDTTGFNTLKENTTYGAKMINETIENEPKNDDIKMVNIKKKNKENIIKEREKENKFYLELLSLFEDIDF